MSRGAGATRAASGGRSPIDRRHRQVSAHPPELRQQARELLDSRDLFLLLFKRELQVRYKQTLLGVVWVALQPIAPALIFAVVFGQFARLPSQGAPYLLFALSGLALYGLLSGTITRAGASFVRDGQLISKVYFPRSVLPLASGSASLVDFGLAGLMIVSLMVVFGIAPTAALLTLPLIVALTLILGLAVGGAVAAMAAHYRDVGHAVPFALQILLYGSPIAYSTEILPDSLVDLWAINPLVPLMDAFRWSLLGTPGPNGVQIALGTLSGALAIATAALIYIRASRDLADVV